MVEDFGLGCVLKGFIETALLRERISFYLSLNIKVGGGEGMKKILIVVGQRAGGKEGIICNILDA